MLGALDFLTDYPYGCTEQTLSSFLPNLLVTRALTELKLAPTERLSALDRQVSAGLQRLYDFQHADGGWGWWKEDGNHPFMTAYALWGLDEARRAGVKVDMQRISNGARELAHLYAAYPRVEPDLKAYEAYVLQRAAADRAADRAGSPIDSKALTRTPPRAMSCGDMRSRHERIRPRLVVVAARRDQGLRAATSSRPRSSAKRRRAATCRGGRSRTIR